MITAVNVVPTCNRRGDVTATPMRPNGATPVTCMEGRKRKNNVILISKKYLKNAMKSNEEKHILQPLIIAARKGEAAQ